MKTFYLRSICSNWFYCIAENACIIIFKATFYPSISLCAVCPTEIHDNLVECSESEYLEVRNEVLKRLNINIPKHQIQDFLIPIYPDYSSL